MCHLLYLSRLAGALAAPTAIAKIYKGDEDRATAAFQADFANAVTQGYFPTSQCYVPGTYRAETFFMAFALCFVIVGIFVFFCMHFIKPDGVLSMTYELRAAPTVPAPASAIRI